MAIKKPAAKAPKADAPRSLADLFDDTDAVSASNLLSEGEHTVRINSFTIKEDKAKGTAATIDYEQIEGEEEGKKIRSLYKLTDAAGQRAQGLGYLKRDLALLGYEDASGAKLVKILKTITEEQPMVIINVQKKGPYVNAFLAGLADGESPAGGESEGKDEVTLEVGNEVTWDDETSSGKITKIKGDSAIVVDTDGAKHTVDLAELTLAEASDESKDETPEIEVGNEVTWTDSDGDDQEGVVLKLKGDKVLVQKADKSKENVDLTDLKLKTDDNAADESNEDEAIAIGDDVIYNDAGDKGKVKKIIGDKLLITDSDGDDIKVAAEKCEKVAAPDDDEIAAGDDVSWDDDGETKTGTVKSINETKGTAKVTDDADGAVAIVSLNDLSKV